MLWTPATLVIAGVVMMLLALGVALAAAVLLAFQLREMALHGAGRGTRSHGLADHEAISDFVDLDETSSGVHYELKRRVVIESGSALVQVHVDAHD